MARTRRREPRGRYIFIILLLALLLLIGFLYYDSNTRLVTTEFKLSYTELPDAFNGFRIVSLADIHGAEFGEDNQVLIDAVKAAEPDIIAIVGDLIDRYQSSKPVEEQLGIAQSLAEKLVSIAPVYYITGNHEWDSGKIKPLLEILKESGVNVLQNQYVRLDGGGRPVILAGVDDPNGPRDMIKPAAFIESIYSNEYPEFLIVLSHRNSNLEMYSELGADLVLSGHAHGGMVRLPFTDGLIGPYSELFPTHTSGVYKQMNTDMVVSRGLGSQFGWTRFLNNPEVVVVELRSK